MAAMKDYDIVGSYNNQRVTDIDAERTINMFEYQDPLGKKGKTLINTSGIINENIIFTNASNGFRQQFVFNNIEYSVIGNNVYQRNSLGVVAQINPPSEPLATTSGYVGIDANNNNQVIFVDGQSGYIWNTSTLVWTRINDPNFPTTPVDVCYLDGFFVVANGGTNDFQLSSFNEGLIWGIVTETFNVTNGSNIITLTSGSTAEFSVGEPIQFTNVPPPIELMPNVTYYILSIIDGSNFTISATNGGLPVVPYTISTNTFTITATTTTVHLTSGSTASYSLNSSIRFTGVPPPPEINTTTNYYVQSIINGTDFTISLTPGGSAISFSVSGSGTVFNYVSGSITNNGELQLGSINAHPGNIVACRTLHRRLFLFSSFFTEVWENAGIGTNLPFRRNNSLLMEYGCAAIGSIRVGFDTMIFLSLDRDGLGAVMQVIGTQSIPISTRALDFQLSQYAALVTSPPGVGVADAAGILLKENGLIFYRLNFTLNNHTFVYNVTQSEPTSDQTKYWHEEEVLNGDRHPAQTHSFLNGINYYGNYESPILYEVDPFYHLNDMEAIRRVRIGKSICPPSYQRMRIDRFHLDLVQGINGPLAFTQQIGPPILNNNIPKVFLSISKNGGITYGNQLISPMGKSGQYSYRTVWRKLGTIPRGQGFVPKIEFFNDMPFIILGAAWSMELMPE